MIIISSESDWPRSCDEYGIQMVTGVGWSHIAGGPVTGKVVWEWRNEGRRSQAPKLAKTGRSERQGLFFIAKMSQGEASLEMLQKRHFRGLNLTGIRLGAGLTAGLVVPHSRRRATTGQAAGVDRPRPTHPRQGDDW